MKIGAFALSRLSPSSLIKIKITDPPQKNRKNRSSDLKEQSMLICTSLCLAHWLHILKAKSWDHTIIFLSSRQLVLSQRFLELCSLSTGTQQPHTVSSMAASPRRRHCRCGSRSPRCSVLPIFIIYYWTGKRAKSCINWRCCELRRQRRIDQEKLQLEFMKRAASMSSNLARHNIFRLIYCTPPLQSPPLAQSLKKRIQSSRLPGAPLLPRGLLPSMPPWCLLSDLMGVACPSLFRTPLHLAV